MDLYGRVGSLLEVGTGFHPELTGRENIYLNGAILGMKRAEIDRKFDEIVDFAELEKFLDTPVKHYSSGMYVRLAFAVAAHLDPEILLVDEVLAVGDAAFQKKCLGKMGEVASEGRTVLFVSHNMAAIQGLCRRAIVLDTGRIFHVSETGDAVNAYLSRVEANASGDLSKRLFKTSEFEAHYTGIGFRSASGAEVTRAISGEPLDIVLAYCARRDSLPLEFAIGVYDSVGIKLLHLGTRYSSRGMDQLPAKGQVACHIRKLPLPMGQYRINLSLHCAGERSDHVVGATMLDVESGDFYGSGRVPPVKENKVLIEHAWSPISDSEVDRSDTCVAC